MADPRNARIADLEKQLAAVTTERDTLARRLEDLENRFAQMQVRWVQQAVNGALVESHAHHRSVLTGRCAP